MSDQAAVPPLAAAQQSVAVVGLGAVGTVLAAHLRAAGHRVLACSRTAPASPWVEVAGSRAAGPVELEWVPEGEVLPVAPDWVIIATKISQTAQAWKRVADQVGPNARVLLAQNGVDHQERFAVLGEQPVVPGLVYFNVERTGPGGVRINGEVRGVVLPHTEAGQAAAELFGGSELPATTSPDFRGEAWRKLLVNLTNPLAALTGQRMGVLAVPEMAQLCRELILEGAAVARADGAPVGQAEVEGIVEWVLAAPPHVAPSMLQDRLTGRPMEHEGLFDPVQRIAGQYGVPTPRLDAVMALLKGVEFAPAGGS